MADAVDVILEPDDEIVVPGAQDDPPIVSADDGIDVLKSKLDTETAARVAAEEARAAADRRTQEAVAAANAARTEKTESDLALVTNAIETLNTQQEMIEANMASAAASGDWAEHAKLQRSLSQNEAKLVQLADGKTALEAKAKEPPPVITPITDPVEALAVQMKPISAAWIRAHPEYARDQAKYARMLGAHNVAISTPGIAPDTPEYIAEIERVLGIKSEAAPVVQKTDEPLSEAAGGSRETPPPAAPVRQEPGGGRTVRLTPEEREMAENSGLTDAEYAAQKVALMKEGKIGRLN